MNQRSLSFRRLLYKMNSLMSFHTNTRDSLWYERKCIAVSWLNIRQIDIKTDYPLTSLLIRDLQHFFLLADKIWCLLPATITTGKANETKISVKPSRGFSIPDSYWIQLKLAHVLDLENKNLSLDHKSNHMLHKACNTPSFNRLLT